MDAERMQALVTATEGRMRRSWLAFVAHVREDNPESDVAERIRAGYAEPLVNLDAEIRRLAIGWHTAYIAAGQTTARWLGAQIRGFEKALVEKKLPVFDPGAPPAVQWAAQNRLDLIREIETETRQLIKDVLIDAARLGTNPLEVAKELREYVGLTSYQRGIVENYRRELTNHDYAAALKRELSHGASDRTVAAAMKAGRPMTQGQIDAAVGRYRENWIDMRARTIARTEGLRVAHQGSNELYRQAVERGDLEASQLEQTWVHAGHSASRGRGRSAKNRAKGSGDRPFHVSMNGQKQSFGQPFISGIGGELRYPGDPEASAEETANCRCVVTTRVLPPGGQRSGPGLPGGGAAEEAAVTDEAALEAEAEAAAEEQAAIEESRLAEELGATAEEDLAGELAVGDLEAEPSLAELLDLPGEEDAGGLPLTDEQRRHQQIQEAQQRLSAKRTQLESARARLAQLESEHAVLEGELTDMGIGFERVGLTPIAGETQADEVSWLSRERAAIERANLPRLPEPAATEAVQPYREPGAVTPSDRPAPLGYDSFTYQGNTYYRSVIAGGPYLDAGQLAEHQAGRSIVLGAPNEQIAGFETMYSGDGTIKFRPKTTADSVYHSYTREQVLSGEAAAYEEWVRGVVELENKQPSLWNRLKRLFGS